MPTLLRTIVRPIVTEKSSAAFQDRGEYTFEVHPEANKIEIRNAIEKIYNVKVDNVRTSAHAGKRRRYRFKTGLTRQWKKAVVVLKPEFHIDLF